MALWDRFRRQSPPKEATSLEQYYSSQNSSNVMGWLMAVAALLLIALVVTAVFWSGRWAYNRFVKDDNPGVTTTQQQGTQEQTGVQPVEDDGFNTPGTGNQPAPQTPQPPAAAPQTSGTNTNATPPLPRTGDE